MAPLNPYDISNRPEVQRPMESLECQGAGKTRGHDEIPTQTMHHFYGEIPENDNIFAACLIPNKKYIGNLMTLGKPP